MTMAVEVRGLERHVDEGGERRSILRGIDLTLARGEFVALLGRSGSGSCVRASTGCCQASIRSRH